MRLVWAYDDPEAIDRTLHLLSDSTTLVIAPQLPDEAISYAAYRTGREESALADTQKALETVLRGRDDPSSYLILPVEDLPIDVTARDSLEDVHATFDAWFELALQAAKWLHQRHGGPEMPSETVSVVGPCR